ncbi:MAG: hypothetical protein EPO36_08355 [Chloroflexota bacterium]|nr:MAG: hypothetical protein EPO36_08355 [Chloroflexota bacterium]
MGSILVGRWLLAASRRSFDLELEARFGLVVIATIAGGILIFGKGGPIPLIVPPVLIGSFGLYTLARPDSRIVGALTTHRLGALMAITGFSGLLLGIVRVAYGG